MSITTTRTEGGAVETTATGKDIGALVGAFSETNKAERERRLSGKNTSRRVVRKGREVDVTADRILPTDKLADGKSSQVMPARFLGFDANDRVVYTEQIDENWEPATSRLGYQGWALKAGRN